MFCVTQHKNRQKLQLFETESRMLTYLYEYEEPFWMFLIENDITAYTRAHTSSLIKFSDK